jgi:flagellar biosynthesis GTPase FlhF
MKKRAALGVPLELHFEREEAEAEIADVEAIEVVVVDGVGTEVPS